MEVSGEGRPAIPGIGGACGAAGGGGAGTGGPPGKGILEGPRLPGGIDPCMPAADNMRNLSRGSSILYRGEVGGQLVANVVVINML